MNSKLLSFFGFLAAVAALVALYGKHAILASEPVAAGVQLVAVLFFVWARITMGWRSFHATADPSESARLVTRGPYRLVRHPIYASLWWFVWAGVAGGAGRGVRALKAGGAGAVSSWPIAFRATGGRTSRRVTAARAFTNDIAFKGLRTILVSPSRFRIPPDLK